MSSSQGLTNAGAASEASAPMPKRRLSPRPGGSVCSHFSTSRPTLEALTLEAKRRGTTMGGLVGDLLDAIVEDNLMTAVLDDEAPAPNPRLKTAGAP